MIRAPSRSRAGVLLLLALLLVAGVSRAHERSTSWSTWSVAADRVHVVVTLAARDLAEGLLGVDPASAGGAALREVLIGQLRASVASGPCAPDRASFRALAPGLGRVAWEWTARCPAPVDSLTLESHLQERQAPHHLHVARVVGGGAPVERLLTGGERRVTVRVDDPAPVSFHRAVRLGVEHLAFGADHLAFLLALVLVATGLRSLAASITGFTLGHSLTLALAALGWVHARADLVEALIGLSIVVVAVERVGPRPPRGAALPLGVAGALLALAIHRGDPAVARMLLGAALAIGAHHALARRAEDPARARAAVATVFGLVHGLGFAGALAERPLPPGHLLPALVGFNLGIELAQIVVAALAWVLLSILRRGSPARAAMLVDVAAAATCGGGVYWVVTRLA